MREGCGSAGQRDPAFISLPSGGILGKAGRRAPGKGHQLGAVAPPCPPLQQTAPATAPQHTLMSPMVPLPAQAGRE